MAENTAPEYRVDSCSLSTGRRLTYRHTGDGAGPTVLLLHGMGGSHEDVLALA